MSTTVNVTETVWIPMPDGTRLAARLWLPDGAESRPVPALLEYIPYRRRDRTRLRDEGMHPKFAESGYASLRVDIRGSGDSEGVMRDEYSTQEIEDGAAVVDWIAAQDWCDGNVGMFGKSWGAFSAFQVAALQPPALKAILPVMGTDDRYAEDIHFYGGCLGSDNFWWGSIMQLYNAFPPDPAIVGEGRWRDMWRERLESMTFWPADWMEHQTRDAQWQRGSICENYDDVQIPVFYVGGWADLYCDTAFRIAANLKGPVQVMIGPWAHLYPHEGLPAPKADFIAEATRFWDHWLKGVENGLNDQPPLRFFMLDTVAPAGTHKERAGRWIEEAAWPSPNVMEHKFWLNAADLGNTPSESDDEMSICSPQTFGMAGGDMCSFGLEGDMPGDCRMDAGGALIFRGEPLAEPREILGNAEARLHLSADETQGFVALLLVDEAPDGAQTLITRGFANLTHRERGPAEVTPVVPGEEMEISVRFKATGYRIPAGHRLMIQLASAYWPILWPAPRPITFSLAPGRSFVSVPMREEHSSAPDAHCPIEPVSDVPRPSARLRSGAFERSVSTDLTTGVATARMLIDGGALGPVGKMRLETGTELSDVSERIYTIHPTDPLSARAIMEQESTFERDDWKVRIKTHAEQWATPTTFETRARVTCWEGDEEFYQVEWRRSNERNGM